MDNIDNTGLIPLPKSLRQKHCAGFEFKFEASYIADLPASQAVAALQKELAGRGKYSLLKTDGVIKPEIVFVSTTGLGPEAYKLNVSSQRILLQAAAPEGFFYAVQTLIRLMNATDGVLRIPAVNIADEPQLKWRGLMLDCCRHFYAMDELKKIIDTMAALKLNVFHWHLTEDHAWRLEIRKYPELTAIAAWRDQSGFGLPDGVTVHYKDGKYGGFYSQDDAREIVRYAAERFITVVPEIELPGHSSAPLSVYSWLGCSGGPYTIKSSGGVFTDVYCAGSDKVFEFLRNVLEEVLEIFPSPYIHIGGDECPKDSWQKCPKCRERIRREGLKDEHELQSWFVRQIEQYLNSRGRNLIGWDEILEGGLAPNATVMSWRGSAGGIAAANMGHDVVMAPTTNCYLDYVQSKNPDEPRAIPGGFLPLEQVYALEPVPAKIKPELRKHVIGAQCNMWTEYVQEDRHLEYMLFPRLCALAEVAWTPKRRRGWESFRRRLMAELLRLKACNINFREPD